MRVPVTLLPEAARPFDVVGLGQNSVDLLARLEEFPTINSKQRIRHFARLPGGQVASAMVCCARLGCRTRYIGRFGADELGAIGQESLTAEGVDLEGSVTIPGALTRFAIVLVDAATGDRTVLWDRDPQLAFPPQEVPAAVVTSARVLHVDCDDVEASIAAARAARAGGVVTVIDIEAVAPGVDQLLSLIDIIIASEGFPEAITGRRGSGDALAALAAEFRPALACVTMGPAGSVALCQGREIRTPAFRVPCVDSTGAGDAFRGGFIAGLLHGESGGELDGILRYATAVAALKCGQPGARAGLPRHDQVQALLTAEVSRQPSRVTRDKSPA